MTVTSFLVPAGGVVTAPLLAHALSTDGRGQLAAALAPAGLMLAAGTFGLPDALTYSLAKRPEITRRALLWASSITVALGFACILIVWFALPFLRDGDAELGRLILLGALLTIPALVIGVLRGAATGRQMWGSVATERLINTVTRVGGCVVLFIMHDLTVFSALLINVLTPIMAGLAYVPLLRSARPSLDGSPESDAGDVEFADGLPLLVTSEDDQEREIHSTGMRSILTFATTVWFGSVMSMVLDRADALLMAPLSNVSNLGVYSVAGTISDMPLIVAMAIASALFGVNSNTMKLGHVTNTSRLTLLAACGGCAALGATASWWIVPVFGEQFKAANLPTLMLMGSALVCIPGMMAASGLAAWGRPGLRSVGLGITLVVNLSLFVLLVPRFGTAGACWASILGNTVMTGYMLVMSKRIMAVSPGDFILIRRGDVVRAWSESGRLWDGVASRAARA